MIDIHAHILPGIDDGSYDMAESLDMAQIALDGGTTAIVCTSHGNLPGTYRETVGEEWMAYYMEFRDRLKELGVPLKVYPGMEIFTTPDAVEKMQAGTLLPINGTKYYLVEFAFDESPDYIIHELHRMMRAGFWPVLAHPERYYCSADDPRFLRMLAEEGVQLQSNRGSFFGRFGPDEEGVAYWLLEHGLLSCIASDAHGSEHRTPYLDDVYSMIAEEYSPRLADQLLTVNPQKIVSGERIHLKL